MKSKEIVCRLPSERQSAPKEILVELDFDARLSHIGHVDEDVVGRVTVQGCTESLLVKMVANETNAASKYE